MKPLRDILVASGFVSVGNGMYYDEVTGKTLTESEAYCLLTGRDETAASYIELYDSMPGSLRHKFEEDF